MFRICPCPNFLALLYCGWLLTCPSGLQGQECVAIFTHDLIASGEISVGNDAQDTPAFEEEDIKLQFDTYVDSNGDALYGAAYSVESGPEFGSGQFLVIEGISAVYTVDAALPSGVPTGQVTLSFDDLTSNPEYIQVNGANPILANLPDLASASDLEVATGVQLAVSMQSGSNTAGTMTFTGAVQTVKLGGLTLLLDNVCLISSESPCDDLDGDEVCDDVDPCVGTLDQCGVCNGNNLCLEDIPGCTQPGACNFSCDASIDNGSCFFPANGLDCSCYASINTTASLQAGEAGEVIPFPGSGDLNSLDITIDFETTSDSWVADLLVVITSPSGECVELGGFSASITAGCTDLGGYEEWWPSDWNTSNAGFYSASLELAESGLSGDGTWSLQLWNGFDSGTSATYGAGIIPGFCAIETPVTGCSYPAATNYNPLAAVDDGSCIFTTVPCNSDIDADGICDDVDPCIGVVDALGVCGGDCTADLDGDGECDNVDCCVGSYDECGICNGPGPIYLCGCNTLPPGACDCDGNQLDALGICGGNCISDIDNDGICDNVDDCVGLYDVCGVCNGPGPLFSCGCLPLPAGDCDCFGNQLDALGICGGECTSDMDDDGICDAYEIPGCTDSGACNYLPEATDDNGACEFPTPGFDCDGACVDDQDGDGICDEDEILGCMDETACNYYPPATNDAGCLYPSIGYDCQGNCVMDADGDGVCDANEIEGCTDLVACNYDPDATDETGNCFYALPLYDCQGQCLADADGDGICDGLETLGCTDEQACNYNPNATSLDPNMPCLFPVPGYDCQGIGILIGCMDPSACNFDADATQSLNNAECLYASFGYDCFGNCLDFDGDGTCDVDEQEGCTYSSASNFNPAATEEDGTCEFPEINGNPCPDLDGDGVTAIGDLLILLGSFGNPTDC